MHIKLVQDLKSATGRWRTELIKLVNWLKKTLQKDKVFLDIMLKNEQKLCRLLVSENLLTNLHDYIPINF